MAGNTGPSSAWERSVRRRNVIRLRLGKRMSAKEIAEETGWSEQTIRKDFKWINSQVEKLRDPEFLKGEMLRSVMHLMDHETQDLRDADRENDEQAKHRAKQSMRSSVKLLKEIGGDGETEDVENEDYFEKLPEEIQSGLEEHAEDEIEQVLSED